MIFSQRIDRGRCRRKKEKVRFECTVNKRVQWNFRCGDHSRRGEGSNAAHVEAFLHPRCEALRQVLVIFQSEFKYILEPPIFSHPFARLELSLTKAFLSQLFASKLILLILTSFTLVHEMNYLKIRNISELCDFSQFLVKCDHCSVIYMIQVVFRPAK